MAAHDTISDFLTGLRNASAVRKTHFTTFSAKMFVEIAKILKNDGFVADYKESKDERGHKLLTVVFKYVDTEPAIRGIRRKSKPGCRAYFPYADIPQVLGGLGINILSTSKGLMNDRDARRQKIGGELIASIW
jgi:small subunit ribosomal protein S8